MADVSTVGATVAGAVGGALVAAVNTFVGPWYPRMAAGVLLGALVYLLRSREDHWLRRIVFFAMSMFLGYAAATWVMEWFPSLPAAIDGFFCAALAMVITVAVLDGVSRATPGIITAATTALKDRVVGLIRGGNDDGKHR